MNKRIQQALDGDIDPMRLSSSEREEFRQAKSDFEAVVRAIPSTPSPDLAPAVLARIRREALQERRVVVMAKDGARKPPVLKWLWKLMRPY